MKKGFSLIEMLIAVAILGILSRIVFVSISQIQNSQALEKELDFVKSVIQKTRLESLNAKNGTTHAVYFASTSIQTKESGTTTVQIFNLSDGIVLTQNNLKNVLGGSATSTVWFAKISGYANATGTLQYSLQKNGQNLNTKTLIINGLGIVE